MPLSRAVKAVLVSAVLGGTLIGVLAIYLRRRKPPRRSARRRVPPHELPTERQRYTSLTSVRSPNGDIPRSRPGSQYSGSPAQFRGRNESGRSANDSEASSTVSTVIGLDHTDMTNSPQHLCQMGLDSIQVAVDHWEQALTQLDSQSQDELDEIQALRRQLEVMIEHASSIQQDYERRLFHQASSAALDSAMAALSEMDRMYERERRLTSDTESDDDSFVSASEMADLSDLDDISQRYSHLYLYESALLELKHGSIPCRVLRTKIVNCSSDAEFLAKLHCVRLALGELFQDEVVRDYFTETGRQLLCDMLEQAGRDSSDFQDSFDELMEWVKIPDNWKSLEEELRGRGVKYFSFYDIVLDFILMDSFDDLASPPSSVTSVTHNRWLSNGFKETALATAVWSVLKAKRSMLRKSDGFVAHFYSVSETISPTLAWGFLGPVPELNDLCYFFKDLVCSFISDLFDFRQCRFSTVPELADDVMKAARRRAAEAAKKMQMR